MPTGYTSDLYEGKDVTVSDFILGCARAFGALVTMRDDRKDAPIPDEFPASDYHADAVATAEAWLDEVRSMDTDDIAEIADRDYSQSLNRWRERRAQAHDRRVRYERMLAEVRAWTPPTGEHVGLRDFMVEQLTRSIDFDCSMTYDDRPTRLAPFEWRAQQIEKAQHDIEYHRREHEKEVQRATERSQWVQALRESLPVDA